MSSCQTCSNTIDHGAPNGCKNNGGCLTGGCNKMNVFDWLSNMDLSPAEAFDVVEVRFKGGRKDYFRNTKSIHLAPGESVVVDVPNGHHLGHISLQGELVRLQLRKRNIPNNGEIKSIYRVATSKDLEKYDQAKRREAPTLTRTRTIIGDMKLHMKLSDVEYQADNSKATFYYSADDRVDFRELIKFLAVEFKIRIEMRQISLRQEAGRLGGIGSCGRELCCSTWLTDFKSVSTSAARYQNLSLNPSKLSGQCGRLKCCLNYELESYLDALDNIPKIDGFLLTQKGEAKLQKTDIFKKILWFGYENENTWIPVPAERVKEIIQLNKKGEKPESLIQVVAYQEGEETLLMNKDLEQWDKKFKSKYRRGKKKKRRKPNRRAMS